jgi:hypothetical protein
MLGEQLTFRYATTTASCDGPYSAGEFCMTEKFRPEEEVVA